MIRRMPSRSFSRTSLTVLALGLGVGSASLAGCGRAELLVDEVGGGGSGGSPAGGGGQGGQGGEGGAGGAGGSTCTPIEEICNTVDDDCDGLVDEGCSCTDGQTQPCYSGPPETIGVGVCQQGVQQCKGGAWTPCSGETVPIPESCDGFDNDCDGLVDEGNPGGGAMCTLGLQGVCKAGLTKCQNGAFLCSQTVFPSAEVCDGLDNNCNGQVDEGNPGGGGACDTGLSGACGPGALVCSGGALACQPFQPPSPELCDGLDNDCDGQIDQGNPGGGQVCNTGLPGACAVGQTTCSGGEVVCSASSASMEVCDGVDNDCDGAVDEGNPGGGAACDTGIPGACGPGTVLCQSGALSCVVSAPQVFFTETFANNNAGWTLDQEWQIGPAMASPTMGIFGNPDPAMDHTPTDDNGVAGVVIGGNAQPSPQHPFRWLTSPTIPVDPAATTVILQYRRWLNSDFAPWMTNRVDVFNATTNQWEQVWQSGGSPGITDSAWTKQVHDITAKSKGGSIKVRFGFNIGANGAFLVSQWNVDDVVVTTEACD